MHGHNRLTDNNKTTNDREDEVVGIYICRSRSPYVVAEVVVVVIVVVEFFFFLTVHAHCRNVIVEWHRCYRAGLCVVCVPFVVRSCCSLVGGYVFARS